MTFLATCQNRQSRVFITGCNTINTEEETERRGQAGSEIKKAKEEKLAGPRASEKSLIILLSQSLRGDLQCRKRICHPALYRKRLTRLSPWQPGDMAPGARVRCANRSLTSAAARESDRSRLAGEASRRAPVHQDEERLSNRLRRNHAQISSGELKWKFGTSSYDVKSPRGETT